MIYGSACTALIPIKFSNDKIAAAVVVPIKTAQQNRGANDLLGGGRSPGELQSMHCGLASESLHLSIQRRWTGASHEQPNLPSFSSLTDINGLSSVSLH